MNQRIGEHLLSIALITLIALVAIWQIRGDQQASQQQQRDDLTPYLSLSFIDWENPLHRTLFRETLDQFEPGREARHQELVADIQEYRRQEITEITRQDGGGSHLTANKLGQLGIMYILFLIAYAVVMVLTYYGVQTLGTWRFLRMKQGRSGYLRELWDFWQGKESPKGGAEWLKRLRTSAALLGKAILRGFAYLVLFSPAYVIAYAFKTRIDTDTLFFMIVLGVISNGLLITYGQKFFTFLLAEDRKGYVQTAIVKGLSNSWGYWDTGGIPFKAVFALRKQFEGHVFQHIYLNARYQYLSTIKEQSAFLISGLIIIEMALNIQGHLCYELLQNILYKRYDVVITIVLGIFWVVKGTEILADAWQHAESRRYSNEEPGL
ncbi:MAG TPA: hypothetical protein PKV71_08675 [Calditrichia bacterium]|nr:hypothetical protein [Calditrichota bacterium]HQU70737.1 hypothetical protein [Calditrichia bacterium]HQV31937.1 hypothetical protein [Calditrichia bacterium]